jgi:surface polysaccharide O-acyltransferase-like enzyme
MKEDLRTQSLDLLRFPLAVIVVAEHVFNKETIIISGRTFDVCQFSLYNDFLLFVEGFLRGISVPMFFLISGYVFFLRINHFTKDVYFQKLKNRVFTLLIPFIIWNLPDMFIGFVKYAFNGILPLSTYGVEINLTLRNILSCFWEYNGELFVPISPSGEKIIEVSAFPLNVPLWFLRDLIVVVICTPLIYFIIKHTKYFFITILVALSFIPNINIPFLGSFLFFSIGAYLSISKKDMVTEFGRYFKISMIIYPLFSFLSIIATKGNMVILSEVFKQISVFGFLIFAYNISICVLENTNIRPGKILPSASFFIYVSHVLIFARVTKVMFMLIKPDNGIETISAYTLSIIVTVLSLLTVFLFMKKYTPRILQIVTGRK